MTQLGKNLIVESTYWSRRIQKRIENGEIPKRKCVGCGTDLWTTDKSKRVCCGKQECRTASTRDWMKATGYKQQTYKRTETMGDCQHCGELFMINHGRQRYCKRPNCVHDRKIAYQRQWWSNLRKSEQ